ncbi:BlaI/MecI/CopY family transcriptional regulator [Actinotalea sp. K2]|uniref:BlaI/MecI/CopY family transcriptional regulator n=1 Tax=Actinotalea sp. K2 TaxID=2939438 RepID=UPI00201812DA|nr:BlaI/MecI/CopY family transcriptional regulator [Actinotalea sp. K2]MCL3862278.1 BlaI/MecI/CopY family transcriptional regulator [Actinotalea sp. K2]
MPDPMLPLPRLGALERRVMDVLWDCPDDLCTRRVLERLTTTPLAYTTIATVLTNLTRKGLTERFSTERSWAYRPRLDRNEYVAGLMAQELAVSDDRARALHHLVRGLGPDDMAALREAIRQAHASA